MMNDTTPIRAHCRCGAFQFASTSAPILQLVCHCRQCREVSGQPYSNFSFFKVRDTQTTGEYRTVAFTADSGARTVREVCAACGDMLIDRTEGYPKIVGVVHECFDPAPPFRPAHHVWTDSRLPETVLPPATEALKLFPRGT